MQAVESFLRDGRPGNTSLDAVEIEPPKLNKGETVLDAVERLRRRGRELKADAHRIQSALFPAAYAKQRMREQIEALAQAGEPVVSDVIERDRQIVWPTQQVQSTVYNAQPGAVAFAELEAAVPILVWLHKEALIKRLDAEIDAEADDKAALSHEARQQREAEVMGDLLAVERDEAELIWQAQAKGLPVEHRSDINPVALLGVVTAPPVNGRGTSPEHAWTVRR